MTTYRALYDYAGVEATELSFHAGDLLTVLNGDDEQWWLAELNGKQGFFPCAYVEGPVDDSQAGQAASGHDDGSGGDYMAYHFNPGDECEAYWEADGQWYPCRVEDYITETYEYRVTFTEYQETVNLPETWLRPFGAFDAGTVAAAEATAAHILGGPTRRQSQSQPSSPRGRAESKSDKQSKKEREKAEKEAEKERKRLEKEEKEREKERQKREKEAEKEREKERKRQEKEDKEREKQREKEERERQKQQEREERERREKEAREAQEREKEAKWRFKNPVPPPNPYPFDEGKAPAAAAVSAPMPTPAPAAPSPIPAPVPVPGPIPVAVPGPVPVAVPVPTAAPVPAPVPVAAPVAVGAPPPADAEAKIRELESKFGGKTVLYAPGRSIVSRGMLTKICRFKDEKYYFFLFNDMLVYASYNDGRFILHKKIDIDMEFNVEELPEVPGEKPFRFLIHSTEKSFVVFAGSAAEKNGWVEDLRGCISAQRVKLGLAAANAPAPAASPPAPTGVYSPIPVPSPMPTGATPIPVARAQTFGVVPGPAPIAAPMPTPGGGTPTGLPAIPPPNVTPGGLSKYELEARARLARGPVLRVPNKPPPGVAGPTPTGDTNQPPVAQRVLSSPAIPSPVPSPAIPAPAARLPIPGPGPVPVPAPAVAAAAPKPAIDVSMLSKRVQRWTVSDVCNWLRLMEFEEYVPAFADNKVDGELLITLEDGDLQSEMGVNKPLHRKRLVQKIQGLRQSAVEEEKEEPSDDENTTAEPQPRGRQKSATEEGNEGGPDSPRGYRRISASGGEGEGTNASPAPKDAGGIRSAIQIARDGMKNLAAVPLPSPTPSSPKASPIPSPKPAPAPIPAAPPVAATPTPAAAPIPVPAPRAAIPIIPARASPTATPSPVPVPTPSPAAAIEEKKFPGPIPVMGGGMPIPARPQNRVARVPPPVVQPVPAPAPSPTSMSSSAANGVSDQVNAVISPRSRPQLPPRPGSLSGPSGMVPPPAVPQRVAPPAVVPASQVPPIPPRAVPPTPPRPAVPPRAPMQVAPTPTIASFMQQREQLGQAPPIPSVPARQLPTPARPAQPQLQPAVSPAPVQMMPQPVPQMHSGQILGGPSGNGPVRGIRTIQNSGYKPRVHIPAQFQKPATIDAPAPAWAPAVGGAPRAFPVNVINRQMSNPGGEGEGEGMGVPVPAGPAAAGGQFCSSCGTKRPGPTSRFCASCGSPFS